MPRIISEKKKAESSVCLLRFGGRNVGLCVS